MRQLLGILLLSSGCSQPAVSSDAGAPPRDAPVATDDAPAIATDAPAMATDAPPIATDAPPIDGAPAGAPPDAPGPHPVARSSQPIDGATVVAFVPDDLAPGARVPLIVVKHGFQLSTADHEQLCDRLASHGFVVIGVDTGGGAFGGPTQVDERDATIAAIDHALGGAPFAEHVDPERIAIVGHSRGGKVAVMVAAADARIDAALLLDPVNGCGPGASYSATCPDVTSADLAGSLAMPVGVMGETNNATGGFMPCAPADQNYATIHAALARATWSVRWTFTGADHMDFTDTGGGFAGSFCADGPGDDVAIRAAVRAMAVAFARLHLEGDAAMSEWLAGGRLPAGIERVGP